jgi:A/G-specific adenine glycosylase
MFLPANELRAFRRSLLGWYRRHRRDLPWRRTKDSYRIWISEVMLQQTRVAAVLPYYHQFLERFPNLPSLASAPVEHLLKFWAGLGYYSRARNLHRAAKEMVARHGGRFPRTLEAALALPGVGRYTAAAVLSIAHGERLAVLDGNVARVLARLGAVRGDLRAPRRWRRLEAEAQRMLAARAPGEWNQAMMELGATVCTPRAPRCVECPVQRHCRAQALGIAKTLPEKPKKRQTVSVHIAAAVLLDPAGRTLLLRSAHGKIAELFSRMWRFPAIETQSDVQEETALLLFRHLKQALGMAQAEIEALSAARHTVTYHRITLLPFLARVEHLPSALSAYAGSACTELLRPLLSEIEMLPASSATRKIARAARDGSPSRLRLAGGAPEPRSRANVSD